MNKSNKVEVVRINMQYVVTLCKLRKNFMINSSGFKFSLKCCSINEIFDDMKEIVIF